MLLAVLLSFQQPGDFEIRADFQEKDRNIYRARGNAVFLQGDFRVEADWVVYDELTKELEAGDRIRFERGAERLEAGRVQLNMGSRAGVLLKVKGDLGPGFYVEAAEARRTENGHYDLRDATITTCEGLTPIWRFHASRAVVDPANFVRLRNLVFRFQRVPMFYFPYLVAPMTRRERSSGFLYPSTSTSTTKGRALRESFYWAVNRSADLTLTGEYFTKRGLAGGVDFRAVPKEGSRIDIATFFARDRLNQGGRSARIFAFHEAGRGDRLIAQMDIVNSFVFRQVFEENFDIISSPLEDSVAYLSRNRPELSTNVIYRRTGAFFSDQPTAVIRKSPSIEASVLPRPLANLPFYWSLDASFSGTARRDATLQTPSFVERFDISPALEMPIVSTAPFNFTQRVAVRETYYTHTGKPRVERDSLSRLSVHYAAASEGPRFEREFGTWRHVVEPQIRYRYVSGIDRFGSTLQMDEIDLLANTNEVEYGITNRIFTKHELLSWKISQKYFFDPGFGGAIREGRRNAIEPLLELTGFTVADGRRKFSPIISTIRFSPTPSNHTDVEIDYDTVLRTFRSAGIIGGFFQGQTFSNVAYFFTRRSAVQLPNHQFRGAIGYGNQAKVGWSGALSAAYDIRRALFQGSITQIGYNTQCCGLSLEFMQFDVGARKESRLRFSFSLKNIGSIGTIRRQERLF